MALSIKNPEVERLARELAAKTGESITDAVLVALRERLAEQELRSRFGVKDRLMAIVEEARLLPLLDTRTEDEILGYDEFGIPT
jgi:antitoxin VapB